MPSQRLLGAALLGLLALALTLFVLVRPGADEGVAEHVEGDIVNVAAGLDPETMLREAEAFLATDRPWRAARVMRTYLDEVAKPTPEARLLAARAEAGWGGWDAVHALLADVPTLELGADGVR